MLLEQQRREKLEENEIERIINEENEQQWKKRVDKWKQEQEARDLLMRDVIQERKNQIQRKLDEASRRKENSLAERDEILRQIERASREEEIAENNRKNARRDIQYEVLNQVAENTYNKQMEAKTQVAEHRAQQYAEKMYQQRLEEEMKKLESEKPQQFKHIPTFGKKRY
jgi:crotonobetainyl-CoA:carnitine CoA-transferase CaiB-like acyl-CoA transferase